MTELEQTKCSPAMTPAAVIRWAWNSFCRLNRAGGGEEASKCSRRASSPLPRRSAAAPPAIRATYEDEATVEEYWNSYVFP